MARPLKSGLDYFSLDVKFDDKVENIIDDYGCKGLAVFVALLQKIYGECGWYCEITERVARRLSKHLNIGTDSSDAMKGCRVVLEIINACVSEGIFDRTIYEKYNVLTSPGIQKRYFKSVERREVFEIKNEYLLIAMPKNAVNVDNNLINVGNNSVNVNNNPQSKVKESKVNHSKVYISASGDAEKKNKYGKYNNVLLSNSDIDELTSLYPIDWLQKIDKLSEGIELHGYKYNNHLLAIKQWSKNDNQGYTSPSFDDEEFFRLSLQRGKKLLSKGQK